MELMAAVNAPAGGAATAQALLSTAGALVITAAMLTGLPGFLTTGAYLVVLAIALGLLAALAWGLARFARRSTKDTTVSVG